MARGTPQRERPPIGEWVTDVDGVEVTARRGRNWVTQLDGAAVEDHATVLAPTAGCGELAITASAGTGWLRRRRLVTGDATFDDRYQVQVSDVDAARYWFTADEAAAVATTYDPTALDPFALTLAAGWVSVTSRRRWHDASRVAVAMSLDAAASAPAPPEVPHAVALVEAAIAAIGFIAARGRRLAAAWRARLAPLGLVAAGDEWTTDDRYACALERGGARIRVDFPWQVGGLPRRGLRTRLAIEWPGRPVAAAWRASTARAARPRLDGTRGLAMARPWAAVGAVRDALGWLPDPAASLTAAGVDWLIAGADRVAIGWERIVDDPASLTAAIGALARWRVAATDRAGPYR